MKVDGCGFSKPVDVGTTLRNGDHKLKSDAKDVCPGTGIIRGIRPVGQFLVIVLSALEDEGSAALFEDGPNKKILRESLDIIVPGQFIQILILGSRISKPQQQEYEQQPSQFCMASGWSCYWDTRLIKKDKEVSLKHKVGGLLLFTFCSGHEITHHHFFFCFLLFASAMATNMLIIIKLASRGKACPPKL